VFAHTDMTARDEGAVRSHRTICSDLKGLRSKNDLDVKEIVNL